MNGYRYQNAVDIEGVLFESLETALEYIKDNYKMFCGIENRNTEFVSVSVDERDTLWVEYNDTDEECADNPLVQEFFNIRYRELTRRVEF